jgi:MFS family permease
MASFRLHLCGILHLVFTHHLHAHYHRRSGFGRIQANALASVGGFLALGIVFFFGWLSDMTNKRRLAVIIAHICYLLLLIVARSVHPHVGNWSRWGLWTTVNAFAIGYHPVHNSWVQLSCSYARERSISIAMWVMSAISGLMVGTQYYRADDVPFYSNGMRIQIIMVAIRMLFAIMQEGVYIVHNRKVLKRWEETGGEKPWLYTP